MQSNMLDLVDYRQGRWQDTMGPDDWAHHLIIDAPYSNRTHAAKSSGTTDGYDRKGVDSYAAWGQAQIAEVCAWAKDHVKQWVVSLTDHVLFSIWEDELRKQGYYVFAPVVLVETGRSVRLLGDGPACWATLLVVARPRSQQAREWRALPGAYVVPRSADKMSGGKPLTAMRQIVRDYSDKGETIADLCAGAATTLIASAQLGRRGVGCEVDPKTWAAGRERIKSELHRPLFDKPLQSSLWG